MIDHKNGKVYICCDKCDRVQVEPEGQHNQAFYKDFWVMNPRAKKYTHRCRYCLTAKEYSARKFMMAKFPEPSTI